MNKLYYKNPYQTNVDVSVTKKDHDSQGLYLCLDKTIFYPQGGGQPGDRGMLSGVQVIDTKIIDGEIRHYIEKDIKDKQLKAVLDWKRRYRFMQHHTAQHLITALAYNFFSWATISFHLSDFATYIDIQGKNLTKENLMKLEDMANEKILEQNQVSSRWVSFDEYKKLPVRSRGIPDYVQKEIRIVTIKDVDMNTCAGLHVRNLGELQMITLSNPENYKGGIRLPFSVGKVVRDNVHYTFNLIDEMKKILKGGADDFVKILIAHETEFQLLNKKLKKLKISLINHILDLNCPPNFLFLPAMDIKGLNHLSKLLTTKFADRTFILCGDDFTNLFFCVEQGVKSTQSAQELFSSLIDITKGKGGGKLFHFQGKSILPKNLNALLEFGETYNQNLLKTNISK